MACLIYPPSKDGKSNSKLYDYFIGQGYNRDAALNLTYTFQQDSYITKYNLPLDSNGDPVVEAVAHVMERPGETAPYNEYRKVSGATTLAEARELVAKYNREDSQDSGFIAVLGIDTRANQEHGDEDVDFTQHLEVPTVALIDPASEQAERYKTTSDNIVVNSMIRDYLVELGSIPEVVPFGDINPMTGENGETVLPHVAYNVWQDVPLDSEVFTGLLNGVNRKDRLMGLTPEEIVLLSDSQSTIDGFISLHQAAAAVANPESQEGETIIDGAKRRISRMEKTGFIEVLKSAITPPVTTREGVDATAEERTAVNEYLKQVDEDVREAVNDMTIALDQIKLVFDSEIYKVQNVISNAQDSDTLTPTQKASFVIAGFNGYVQSQMKELDDLLKTDVAEKGEPDAMRRVEYMIAFNEATRIFTQLLSFADSMTAFVTDEVALAKMHNIIAEMAKTVAVMTNRQLDITVSSTLEWYGFALGTNSITTQQQMKWFNRSKDARTLSMNDAIRLTSNSNLVCDWLMPQFRIDDLNLQFLLRAKEKMRVKVNIANEEALDRIQKLQKKHEAVILTELLDFVDGERSGFLISPLKYGQWKKDYDNEKRKLLPILRAAYSSVPEADRDLIVMRALQGRMSVWVKKHSEVDPDTGVATPNPELYDNSEEWDKLSENKKNAINDFKAMYDDLSTMIPRCRPDNLYLGYEIPQIRGTLLDTLRNSKSLKSIWSWVTRNYTLNNENYEYSTRAVETEEEKMFNEMLRLPMNGFYRLSDQAVVGNDIWSGMLALAALTHQYASVEQLAKLTTLVKIARESELLDAGETYDDVKKEIARLENFAKINVFMKRGYSMKASGILFSKVLNDVCRLSVAIALGGKALYALRNCYNVLSVGQSTKNRFFSASTSARLSLMYAGLMIDRKHVSESGKVFKMDNFSKLLRILATEGEDYKNRPHLNRDKSLAWKSVRTLDVAGIASMAMMHNSEHYVRSMAMLSVLTAYKCTYKVLGRQITEEIDMTEEEAAAADAAAAAMDEARADAMDEARADAEDREEGEEEKEEVTVEGNLFEAFMSNLRRGKQIYKDVEVMPLDVLGNGKKVARVPLSQDNLDIITGDISRTYTDLSSMTDPMYKAKAMTNMPAERAIMQFRSWMPGSYSAGLSKAVIELNAFASQEVDEDGNVMEVDGMPVPPTLIAPERDGMTMAMLKAISKGFATKTSASTRQTLALALLTPFVSKKQLMDTGMSDGQAYALMSAARMAYLYLASEIATAKIYGTSVFTQLGFKALFHTVANAISAIAVPLFGDDDDDEKKKKKVDYNEAREMFDALAALEAHNHNRPKGTTDEEWHLACEMFAQRSLPIEFYSFAKDKLNLNRDATIADVAKAMKRKDAEPLIKDWGGLEDTFVKGKGYQADNNVDEKDFRRANYMKYYAQIGTRGHVETTQMLVNRGENMYKVTSSPSMYGTKSSPVEQTTVTVKEWVPGSKPVWNTDNVIEQLVNLNLFAAIGGVREMSTRNFLSPAGARAVYETINQVLSGVNTLNPDPRENTVTRPIYRLAEAYYKILSNTGEDDIMTVYNDATVLDLLNPAHTNSEIVNSAKLYKNRNLNTALEFASGLWNLPNVKNAGYMQANQSVAMRHVTFGTWNSVHTDDDNSTIQNPVRR